jgi:hypothetical protein
MRSNLLKLTSKCKWLYKGVKKYIHTYRDKLPEEILLLKHKERNFLRTLELLRAARKFLP